MRVREIALLFALACCLYAQASETQQPVSAPASEESVQKMEQNITKEIQRLSREGIKARKAAEKAALRDAEARKKIVEENAAALRAAEARMESIAREAQNSDRDRLRHERRIRYAVGLALPLGLLFIWFLIRKSQKVVLVSSAIKDEERIPDIITDPDLPTMRKALAIKKEQKFFFVFRDGRKFECLGKVGPDSKIIAYIKDDPDNIPVVFEKVGRRINKLLQAPAEKS